MNLETKKEPLGLEFLFGEVYINKVKATWIDKLDYWADRQSGKVKSRIYKYNGIIDVETE